MIKPRTLDFSLLAEVESMPIFIRLAEDVEALLKTDDFLQEIYDRAKASLFFLVKGDEADERWRAEARLRAGLNEFYSLEDAARRVFRKHHRILKPPKLAESKHPLVHAMYALRHINVHVKPTATRREQVQVVCSLDRDPHEFEINALMLSDETLTDVLSTAEVQKYYSAGQMRDSIEWMLRAQTTFGIGSVLQVGLEQYCREVLSVLPTYAQPLLQADASGAA